MNPAPAQSALARVLAEAKALGEASRHVDGIRLLRSKLADFSKTEKGRVHAAIAKLQLNVEAWKQVLESVSAAKLLGVDSSELQILRADALRELTRTDEAAAIAREVLEGEPKHALASLCLARILFRTGQAAESLGLFRTYFEKTQESEWTSEAELEQSRALIRARQFDQAADSLTELLERDPYNVAAYSELSKALLRAKRREPGKRVAEIYKALSQRAMEEHVEVGLQRSGRIALGLAQRAINLIERRQFLAGFAIYEQALGIQPDEVRVRIFAAEALLRLHRSQEALRLLKAAPAGGFRSGLLWLEARCLAEEERWAETLQPAASAFAALKAEGDKGGYLVGQANPIPLFLLLAQAALETGDIAQSTHWVTGALKAAPNLWAPYYWRGRGFLAQQKWAEAATWFAKAAARGGGASAELAYWNSVAIRKLGRSDLYRRQLDSVIKLSPMHSDALQEIAKLDPAFAGTAAEAKKIDDEIRIERRKLHLAEGMQAGAASYGALGLLYARRKETALSVDALAIAADLQPKNAQALLAYANSLNSPELAFVRLGLLRRAQGLIAPNVDRSIVSLCRFYVDWELRLGLAVSLARKLAVSGGAEEHALLIRALLAQKDASAARAAIESAKARFAADSRWAKYEALLSE